MVRIQKKVIVLEIRIEVLYSPYTRSEFQKKHCVIFLMFDQAARSKRDWFWDVVMILY